MATRGRSSSLSSGVAPLLHSDEHQELGVTPLLKEYIKLLCEHPSTWLDFPLQDHLKQKSDSRRGRSLSALIAGPQPPQQQPASTSTSPSTPPADNEKEDSGEQLGKEDQKLRPPREEQEPQKPSGGYDLKKKSKSETAASIATALQRPDQEVVAQPAKPESSLFSWFGSLLRDKTEPAPPPPQPTITITSTVKDPEDGWQMTKKQRQHALLVLKEVPQLMGIRQQLVPKHLSEDTFWRIYFLLMKNKLGHLLEEEVEDEEDSYDRTKPARHASTWNLCHRSAYAQMFGGTNSKLRFEDSALLPVSSFYPWWRAHAKGFRDEKRYSATKSPEVLAKEEENAQVKGWDSVDIKRLKAEVPNQLRKLVREGVPDDHRRMAWTYSVGTREFLQNQPTYFEDSLNAVFGEQAPESCNPIPTFGGSMLYRTRHCLKPEGVSAFKRTLVLLAMTNEYVEFAPLIPDVLCILLSFLPEDEAFVTMQMMIAHSEKQCRFLWLSQRDVFLACTSFVRMLENLLPDLHKAMVACQVRILELIEELFCNFFLPWLPYQTVLHLFDCYALEGTVVLFRVGLGIFSECSGRLKECTTRQDFLLTLHSEMGKLTNSESLILGSFKFVKLKHSTLMDMYKAIGDTVSQTHMNNSTVFYAPKVPSDLSKIISKEQWETLWYWVPPRQQIEEPKLLFATSSDGYNLNTLTNQCSVAKPQILLIKTQTGCIFGAFVSDPWPTRPQEHFFGNGESFLFALHPKEAKYRWRMGNRAMFMLRREDCIAVGGGTSGGFGLWLDQELLNGRAETCETFENEPLYPYDKDFQCVGVEVFTFR